jgi:geranylgeranyl pyrophosphate synthase
LPRSQNEKLSDEKLIKLMEQRSKKVLERFEQAAVSGVTCPELLSILEYLKSYWKEKLRPALTSFSCEAVGGKPEMAEEAGLMFTLAAAGTQIHDEIIDNSSRSHLRRTIFGIYGVDNSLLVGDLLLVKAWTILNAIIKKNRQPIRIADIIGSYGMLSIKICEAELMEISCRRRLDTDLKDYEKKFLWMINADLEACAKAGAILGDGSDSQVQALAEVGRRLGFMIGLKDDIKDSLNLEGNLQHRLKYESVPLPILFAAKSSQEKHLRIQSILEKSSMYSSDVAELLEMCFETDAFIYARDIAKRNASEATRKLRTIKPSIARSVLELIVEKTFADVAKMCV